MNDEFEDYLRELLDMPTPLFLRVNEIYKFYKKALPIEPDRIFVTDVVTSEGREFVNLWFFAGDYAAEAHNFVTEDDFDSTYFPEIQIWRITKSEYDFKTATNDSRLILTFNSLGYGGELRASGANCDVLRKIFLEWVAPRLATP